jgi:hypothetical protein
VGPRVLSTASAPTGGLDRVALTVPLIDRRRGCGVGVIAHASTVRVAVSMLDRRPVKVLHGGHGHRQAS